MNNYVCEPGNEFLFCIRNKGVQGVSFQGDIAIDDVKLMDNPCPPPGDCNFESDMCTWTNVQNSGDQFDWLRGSGGTPSSFTGPAIDHTTGTAQGKNNGIRLCCSNLNVSSLFLIFVLLFFVVCILFVCLEFWILLCC